MATQWLFMPIVDVITNSPIVNYITLFIIGMFSMIMWLIFHKAPRVDGARPLTDEERNRLIREWQPQALVTDVSDQHAALNRPVVTAKVGLYTEVDGVLCINMASNNFLGLLGHPLVEKCAVASISKYGVGSCGPRGFYGTVDVHLELEERLARFMDMEEVVVYSYNFSTVASAIPAYAKRGDVIFVDEHVNFAIQKGMDASRSKIVYFKHNDMACLEELIKTQIMSNKKNPSKGKVRKQFLIVEGIYVNSGDICPLPELVRIRNQYELRLFIDESISFGTLGAHGRGVLEHFNIPKEEIDLLICSMEHSMASIGGFCVGSSFIAEHQRLSGLGYCFSASLPPFLASCGIATLDLMERDTNMFKKLQNLCIDMDIALREVDALDVGGDPISPVKHLRLASSIVMTAAAASDVLHSIVNYCLQHGVALVVAPYLEAEVFEFKPSIRITVNRKIPPDAIRLVVSTLQDACRVFLPSFYESSG